MKDTSLWQRSLLFAFVHGASLKHGDRFWILMIQTHAHTQRDACVIAESDIDTFTHIIWCIDERPMAYFVSLKAPNEEQTWNKNWSSCELTRGRSKKLSATVQLRRPLLANRMPTNARSPWGIMELFSWEVVVHVALELWSRGFANSDLDSGVLRWNMWSMPRHLFVQTSIDIRGMPRVSGSPILFITVLCFLFNERFSVNKELSPIGRYAYDAQLEWDRSFITIIPVAHEFG